MNVFTQPLHNKQDVAQGQFLSGVQPVWILSFPSRLVAIATKAKEPSVPSYLPLADEWKKWILAFSKGKCTKLKHKLPYPETEPKLPSPFPTTIIEQVPCWL